MSNPDRGLVVSGAMILIGVVFLAIAALIPAAGRHPAPMMAAARPVQTPTLAAYFSPHGGCTEALVGLIGSARKSVRVQAYSFTSRPIADALIAAHRRKVAVEIVLDESQRTARGSRGGDCRNAGIPVVYDAKHVIAHNKVMVIDGKAVACGSFNFTASAENVNAENLLIVRDAATAAEYGRHWAEHRSHSEP